MHKLFKLQKNWNQVCFDFSSCQSLYVGRMIGYPRDKPLAALDLNTLLWMYNPENVSKHNRKVQSKLSVVVQTKYLYPWTHIFHFYGSILYTLHLYHFKASVTMYVCKGVLLYCLCTSYSDSEMH